MTTNDDLTRRVTDAVLALYRPGRTVTGDLFLANHDGRVPFGGRPDRVRGVIVQTAIQDSDDVLPESVKRSVYDVLVGRALGAEPETWEPETAPEPIDTYDDVPDEDGTELLDDLVAYKTRYCLFPIPEQADAVALWDVHTHVYDVFTVTPRLVVKAPTVACGKTRVLEVSEPFVAGPRLAISVSGPYLFRTIGREDVTVLLDEYENVWRDRSEHGQDFRAIITAGNRKGSMVGRVVIKGDDHVPTDFPVFCPVALAGVGRLPDAVDSRSVHIAMRRRRPDEPVRPFDRDEAWEAAAPLARRLRAWAWRNRDRLNPRPELPDGLEDREAEVWRPLFAISELVGGHWPGRVRNAWAALTGAHDGEDEATALLTNIRAVFDGTDQTDEDGNPTGDRVDKIFSSDLVDRLCAREEWPWSELKTGPLTAPGLAKRLRDFEVSPKQLRIGAVTKKGYERVQFIELWDRFVGAAESPPYPAETAETLETVLVDAFRPVSFVPDGTTDDEDGEPESNETPRNAMTRTVKPVSDVSPEGGGSLEREPDSAGRARMAAAREAAGAPLTDEDRAALAAEDGTEDR